MKIRLAAAGITLLALLGCAPPQQPPPSGPPSQTCTNGVTIGEGAGTSFFESDGQRIHLIHNNNWNDTAGGNSVITACNYNS